MINVNVPALLDTVSKLATTAGSVQSKSLIQYTGSTRITPFTLIDRSLLAVPELQDILQTDASLYSGYYLMGVQLSVNSIDGISVIRQLDKLKPTRRTPNKTDIGMAGLATLQNMARENYTYRLPMGDKPLKPLVLPSVLATESNDNKTPLPKQAGVDKDGNPIDSDGKRMHDKQGLLISGTKHTQSSTVGGKSIETVTQDSNLAVGKMLEVSLNINGQQMSIPVQVRLNTFIASPTEVANIVANVDPHKSGGEIKALYQAGLIDLWDALTGKQAANEWRKAALEDKTGTILRESQRRTGNKVAAVLSGEKSYGDISGIYVISANTARMIEGEIGGKLSNFSVREKLLARTGVMLLTVVDTDWKRVTIYHHSIDGNSSYSFADLKRGGKSNNHDIGMVLEAFRQGQAPSKFF